MICYVEGCGKLRQLYMWGIVNRSFWGSILNRTTQYNGMSQGFWRTAQMCKELQAQTFVQRVVVFFESFLCPAKETVDKIRKKLKTRVDTVHLPKNNYFWSYLSQWTDYLKYLSVLLVPEGLRSSSNSSVHSTFRLSWWRFWDENMMHELHLSICVAWSITLIL